MTESYINSLIMVASGDIKASKTLYKKELYPQSLFLLQQAIEKAYKAIGLITRQISVSDLRSVSHDFIKMLKRGFGNINESSRSELVKNQIKKFDKTNSLENENIEAELSMIQNKDFFNLNNEDIQFIFTLLKALNRSNYPLKLTKTKHLIEIYRLASQSSSLTDEEQIELQDLIDSTTNGLSKEESIKAYHLKNYTTTLNLFGLLTSPNFQHARYPMPDSDNSSITCPTNIFQIDTPIIMNMPYILRHSEKAIKFLASNDWAN
jgi:hypothetical protein